MRVARVRYFMAEMVRSQPFSSLHELLRYDVGFVRSVDDQGEKTRAGCGREIIVALPIVTARDGAALGRQAPTLDTWRSHGVPIRAATDRQRHTLAPSLAGFIAAHDRWVTYRYPRDLYGSQVYGVGLVPESLTAYTDPRRRDTYDL